MLVYYYYYSFGYKCGEWSVSTLSLRLYVNIVIIDEYILIFFVIF